MTPDELLDLADRLDQPILHLNPYAPHAENRLTKEQRDLLWACISLRRYARDQRLAKRKAAPGRVYMRGFKFERVSNNYPSDRGCGDQEWHRAINLLADARRELTARQHDRTVQFPRTMYQARQLSDEVPRMILLFEQERRGQQNHLRCHLGVECHKCEYLGAIEASPTMTNEAKDEAKAWTCAAHILLESNPDDYIEEYLGGANG